MDRCTLCQLKGICLRVQNTGCSIRFGPKRKEVKGSRRKLRNYDIPDLYPSLSIIQVISSMTMRWTGHVVLLEDERFSCKVFVPRSV